MKVAVFSSRHYDRQFLDVANRGSYELRYVSCRLTSATVAEAKDCSAVCLFANDLADAEVIQLLAVAGVKLIALRSAGFDNVDLKAAHANGISVARVPLYSPNAVAEHAFALLLALNRKVHFAYNRVRSGNFTLDGLIGFDLAGKTVGIIGVGNIGSVAAKIANGFGCHVIGADPVHRKDCSEIVDYVTLNDLLAQSDVVSLHCPLNERTRHLIGSEQLAWMRSGAILVNTSRGACVDTAALMESIEVGALGGAALDVYENERGLFFEDHSGEPISDVLFTKLVSCPRVLVTGHQAYLTTEALSKIAQTTIENIEAFERIGVPTHEVTLTDLHELRTNP